MNRSKFVAVSLVLLTLTVSVSDAATEEYSANIHRLEILFGDGKQITKLYSGKRQPDAKLAQIIVLSGLTISAVDGNRVKSKHHLLGYRAYKQLPGTYKYEVMSWQRRKTGHYVGRGWGKLDEQAAYALQVDLEAGQKYVLSPIWNDGEMGIIAPSQVCLQGQSDNARYCAVRPRESDDVFAMDEKHGVIVIGLTGTSIWERMIMINVDCEWRSPKSVFVSLVDKGPALNNRKAATKLRDVCYLGFEPVDSKRYIVESVDAGVWKWWGVEGIVSWSSLIQTTTFGVEPGKVNYVGHIGTEHVDGKLVGFTLADGFSLLESTLRAGFGDSEIVNKATHYSGFGDAEIEKKTTDY